VRQALAGSVLTGVLAQLFLVASGVIVARALGPTDRGYLALVVLIPVVIQQLGHLGLATGMTFFIAKDPPRVVAIVRRMRGVITLQICVLTAVQAGVVLLVLKGKPTDVREAGILTLTLVASGFLQEYVLAILQGLRAFLPFNVLRTAPGFLYAAGVVALYAVGTASLVPIVLVIVVTHAAAAGVGAWLVRRRFGSAAVEAPVDATPTRSEVTRFGLKGYLGATSPIEALRVDQTVIALFLPPAALGLYVAALAFTNLPRFIGQSIGLVAYPYVANQPDPRQALRSVWRFTALCAVISTPIVIVLILGADRLVPFMFGESFAGAAGTAQWLLAAALLVAVRRVLADGGRGLNRPLIGTVAEVSTWFCFIVLLLFVRPSSPVDVAQALLGAAAAGLALTVVLVLRQPGRSGDGASLPAAPPAPGAPL
jgi:O-antigen/teichoic acid export membrane protein